MRRYVNAFVFRLNEGNVRNHTMVRLDHIIRNAVGKRITYKELTADASQVDAPAVSLSMEAAYSEPR